MKFWDSSGLVPLIVMERETDYCLKVLSEDREMIVWCLSRVEIKSALCRRVREGLMSDHDFQIAKKRLDTLMQRAYEVMAVEKVRSRALRLLEVHPLAAADACQLAAALVAGQEDPVRLPIITFGEGLKKAAAKEGFVTNLGREE
jgi:predicted nucleic acid-binding protein